MQPIALSTSWNGSRHQSADGLLREDLALGFHRVEAYSHFTPDQLEALLRSAPDLGVEIASFHGPCPISPDRQQRALEGGDQLASTDEGRRRHAVDAFLRTIDWAGRHGIRAVVVHLGHVELHSRQGEILKSAAERGRSSEVHRRLLELARRERETAKGPYLAAAQRSIRTLGEQAAGAGVRLGLECRDGYHEIPSLEEMGDLLDACDGLPVGYWHDAGHAAKLEYAGFLEQEEYLRRYGSRLVGMHLHDFDGRFDHQPPGQGRNDFGMLAGYLRPETLITLELAPRATPSEIVQALDLLRSYGLHG